MSSLGSGPGVPATLEKLFSVQGHNLPVALMTPFLREGILLLFCLWNTCQNGGCREQLAIGFFFDSDKSPDSQCWLQSSTYSRLNV